MKVNYQTEFILKGIFHLLYTKLMPSEFFSKPNSIYFIRGHSCILRSRSLPHHHHDAFDPHFSLNWSFPYGILYLYMLSPLQTSQFFSQRSNYHIISFILFHRQFLSAYTCIYAIACLQNVLCDLYCSIYLCKCCSKSI